MDINKVNLSNGYKIIEASAGTGKTFTLSHLFLRTYIEKKYNLDKILLLSFTNKTCNELRERIIQRFHKLELFIEKKIQKEDIDVTLFRWYEKQIILHNNENEIIYKIKEFFKNINNLKIFTFHGFCSNILENYSFEIKSQQDFTVNNELDEFYTNIINELWIYEYTNLKSDIISSIKNKKIKCNWSKVKKINKKFFINLLKEIDNENIYKFNYKEHILKDKDLSIYLENYLNINWENFVNLWQKDGFDLFSKLKELGSEIKNRGFKSILYTPNPRNKFEQINIWIKNINQQMQKNKNKIYNYYEITQFDLLSKYFYRKSIYSELDKFNIKVDLDKFDALQESIYKLKDGFFNIFVRIFISKAYANLISIKRKKGIINFTDIIKIIEQKLLNNNESDIPFEDISNRYKTVFIDEFQDTDQVQWGIISKFFKDNNHLLISVGDPKQAIYKFRGGDIKSYLQAKNDANQIYKLNINYRSSDMMIDIINNIYIKGLKASNIKYEKLSCNKNKILESKFEKPLQIYEFSENNFIPEYTVNCILRLIISTQNLRLEDIAILTNDNYQCLIFKKLFQKYNIPCNLINKKNIFDTEAGCLIEKFLECLSKPNSSKNIISIASSKLFQINIDEIVDYEKSHKVNNLFKLFKYWSNKLPERGFISIIREFLIKFKSSPLVFDIDLYNNIIQLSEIIEEKLIKENTNLEKILNWYRYQLNENTRSCKGEEFLVKNNNYSDISGIKVSTIHSSKGLEYEVVICPYLWDETKIVRKMNGPIWRDRDSNELYINIETSCKKVEKIRTIEKNDQINELERLIYVALTRAKYKLIIFNNTQISENIISKYLLPNLNNYDQYKADIEIKLEDNEIENIKNKFNNKVNNDFEKINNLKKEKLKFPTQEKRSIRSSYSSWTSSSQKYNLYNLNKDYDENLSLISTKEFELNNFDKNFILNLKKENPLSKFPRGTNSGTFIHRIIERINLNDLDNIDKLNLIIKEELSTYGFDESFLKNIIQGIKRIFYCSLGKKLFYKRLIDMDESNIIKEVKFDLPLSIKGKIITTDDLANCFLFDEDKEFYKDYSEKIKELNIFSKGFHSGCIDCLLNVKGNNNDSKWWIIDWKSNFITAQGEIKSLPINYNYKNMRAEMLKHHYPLQSHLYLLAAHRLLKWRLKNYNPNLHLGGYIYIFVRGLPNIELNSELISNNFYPGIFSSEAPLSRILYLDKLFNNEI